MQNLWERNENPKKQSYFIMADILWLTVGYKCGYNCKYFKSNSNIIDVFIHEEHHNDTPLRKSLIKYPNYIIIAQLNTNSVRNKFELHLYLIAVKDNFLLISDTEIDSSFPKS